MISIAIPAFNEQRTIGEVIKRVPRNIKGVSRVQILVVNDNSTDITPIHFPLDNSNNFYTVPTGKTLIVRSGWGQAWSLTINGTACRNFSGIWIVPSGNTLGTVVSNTTGYTGYLIDNETN